MGTKSRSVYIPLSWIILFLYSLFSLDVLADRSIQRRCVGTHHTWQTWKRMGGDSLYKRSRSTTDCESLLIPNCLWQLFSTGYEMWFGGSSPVVQARRVVNNNNFNHNSNQLYFFICICRSTFNIEITHLKAIDNK